MKKLYFILIIVLPLEILFAQDTTMVLTFNQDNLVPSTNTFKCKGSFTYFTINTFPADTSYTVTLTKNGQVFEQGVYSSINNQSPGIVALDSLIFAGDYELTLVSSTNITFSDTFSFQDPEALDFAYTTTNPQSCIQYGEIMISGITGGTPPYSLGKVDALGQFDPLYFNNLSITEYTVDSLIAGFYSVSLQDTYGCVFTVGSINPIEIVQGPDPLNIISTSQEDSFRICLQGGVLPYNYVLNGDTITTNDSCLAYALCPGNYSIIVFDGVSDSLCADSLDFTINDLVGYIDQESSTMIVESGGVRPLSYSWIKNNELQDGQTDSIFQGGLCPASYTCNVVDRANCLFSFDLSIDELESNLIEDVDCFDKEFSSLETNVSGGTSPYEYLWSTNETTSSISDLSPQKYILTVIDNNGCELIDEIDIPVLLDSCLFNAFTPNGDLINDTWVINPTFLYENTEVIIYNRWGAKVYQSLGYKQAWNGRNESGNLVKEGVYFYSILLNNGHDKIKGTVSVFY